jgi:hypothetical protein
VASLSTVNFDDVIYEPYVLAAKELSTELKEHDVIFLVISSLNQFYFLIFLYS